MSGGCKALWQQLLKTSRASIHGARVPGAILFPSNVAKEMQLQGMTAIDYAVQTGCLPESYLSKYPQLESPSVGRVKAWCLRDTVDRDIFLHSQTWTLGLLCSFKCFKEYQQVAM